MQMSLPRLRGSSYGHAGMTPEQIAEVRPRLAAFAGEMLGGLARSDQRAAGELYVRGLLTGGQRKSMVPMAERLGVDHQRLQQFITSSTWDYAAVRRNVARGFAASQPGGAPVGDDTGLPEGGTASPCAARGVPARLGRAGPARGGPTGAGARGSPTATGGGPPPPAGPTGGRGRPPSPAYPGPPATVRQLAIAAADQVRPVTWRQGTKTT